MYSSIAFFYRILVWLTYIDVLLLLAIGSHRHGIIHGR